MANKKTAPKPRAEKYDKKVSFNGTLEQMIKIAGNTKPPAKQETDQKEK